MRRAARNALIAALLVAGTAGLIAAVMRQLAGSAQAPADAMTVSQATLVAPFRVPASPQPANSTTVPAATAPRRGQKFEQRALPAAGTPLKQTQKQLAARAADGDASAASRLFRDTLACLGAHQQRKAVASSSGWPPEDLLNEAQSELDRLRSFDALCAGLDADIEDGRIYAISLQAADLGDATAACFYLNAPLLVDDGRLSNVLSDVVDPTSPPPVSRLDPSIVAQYQANAIRIGAAGADSGDWNSVEALMQLYAGGFLSFSSPLPADPVWSYRYHLLWRLGEADPEVLKRNEDAALDTSELTVQEVAAARVWASTAYREHFAQRPIMPSEGHRICSIPPLHGLP